MTEEQVIDVAHLGHVELLTSKPEDSLRYFVDIPLPEPEDLSATGIAS